MKNKFLKELRLGVGITPANKPPANYANFVSLGGFHSNADDVIQKRQSLVNEDEEDFENEEDDMSDNILEYRVYSKNGYQLVETLENIDEGFVQKTLDALKAIPGLDQVVGDIELYLQAGEAKDAFEGFSDIVDSLQHAAGTTALAVFGTKQQFGELVGKFTISEEEDKEKLKGGIEKLLDILKNMIITAAQTFDSIVALPTFAAAGIGGVVGEAAANIITSMGTFIRDQPVEQFVFKTITERSGIISKVVELFEKVYSMITGGGAIGKALGYVISKISSAGGEIVKLFLTKPFELFRRLGDLYKAAIGEPVEGNEIEVQPNEIDTGSQEKQSIRPADNRSVQNVVYESHKKYSILFLLESVDEGGPASTKKYDDHPALKGGQSKLPDSLQKGIISKSKNKKNEMHHDEESFEEIDLAEFSSAGAVGGYAIPQPGPNPNKPNTKKAQTAHHKLFEKQLEEVLRWQAFHQKTSNKLK